MFNVELHVLMCFQGQLAREHSGGQLGVGECIKKQEMVRDVGMRHTTAASPAQHCIRSAGSVMLCGLVL